MILLNYVKFFRQDFKPETLLHCYIPVQWPSQYFFKKKSIDGYPVIPNIFITVLLKITQKCIS